VCFRWGYGHVVIFASLAAMGAGLHVATEAVSGHADSGVAAMAVAVPVAGFLLGLVLLMALTGVPARSPQIGPKLAGAAVVLVLGAVTSPAVTVAGGAAVMLGLTGSMVASSARAPAT
jgi:low temperature requirement protein LtrA